MLSGNQRGILFILIGMTISSVQDTLIKLLSDDLSIFQIQFFRSLVGIGVIVLFQITLRQPLIVTTAYPALSLLRGIMFFGAYSLFYFAQSKIPIANATVLYLANPFFTTLIAILIFKSQVGFKHWLIIIFGFFGVVLIYQPNTKVFNVYYLLPILVALLYSLIVTKTKLTPNKDTLFQQLFYTYLVTVFLSGLLGLTVGDGRFDTVHVAVVDDTGEVTGVEGQLLEVWKGLSKASDAVMDGDSPTKSYYKKYIQYNSSYVYAGYDPSITYDTQWDTYPRATGFSTQFTANTFSCLLYTSAAADE